jgi:hypothetical protein
MAQPQSNEGDWGEDNGQPSRIRSSSSVEPGASKGARRKEVTTGTFDNRRRSYV